MVTTVGCGGPVFGPIGDGGVDAASACGAGQIACGAVCIDISRDHAHCGSCATACAAAEVCSMGACAPSCPTAQNACSGACFDLQTSAPHCGACTTACAVGEACSGGHCGLSCGGGTPTLCGTDCVDTDTNRLHCGTCATVCGAGEVCSAGACALSCGGTTPLLCGTSCSDPTTDRMHCGDCATVCPAGEVCSGGACGLSCGGTTPVECAGECADLQTDRTHCGNCVIACAAGEICAAGLCSLSCGGTTPILCGSDCVNTATDRSHCGTCATACVAGEVCSGSLCGLSCGGATPTLCGTECVSTDSNRDHCGDCATVCSAGELCSGGACALSCGGSTPTNCGLSCVDTTNDRLNCGGCGLPCATGELCSSGTCALACGGTTPTKCGLSCVDTTDDRLNCGGCDILCAAGEVCSGSACTLSCGGATPTQCGLSCVDTTNDRNACGGCGIACGAGQICTASACVLSCPSGTPTVCGGACADTTRDRLNCGACGTVCGAGTTCSGSSCIPSCMTGLTACSGVCRDLTTDRNDCGACGVVCGFGQICTTGLCITASPRSCGDLQALPSGRYTIDPDGSGGVAPFDAFCDNADLGGGWTLVLKADGLAPTWQYDSAIWTDATVLNVGSTDLSATEAKFRSYDTVAFDEVMLMTNLGGVFRTERLATTSTSMRTLINAGFGATSLGSAGWGALFGGAAIQPNCGTEGYDVGSAAPYARVRIGIIGNNEPDCSSPDSFMGIGGTVGPGNGCVGPDTSVGVVSGCGVSVELPAFAYVFVRQRLPGAYAIPFAPQATTGTSVLLSDDETTGLLPLGFSFRFFANTYTQVNISSNGFVGFDAGMSQGCCSGRDIPAADDVDNIIAAAWTDLFPPGGGSITYETRGVAPRRRFVVSYGTMPWCCSGPERVTTQIILFEGTDLIEVHTTTQDAGNTYTQGVEDAGGTTAYSLPGRSAASYALSNDGAQFVTY